MKVKKLIELLSKQDPNAIVVISMESGLTKVRLCTGKFVMPQNEDYADSPYYGEYQWYDEDEKTNKKRKAVYLG